MSTCAIREMSCRHVSEGTPRSGWRSLTAELGASGSPLREFLAARLPNTKEVYAQYRDAAGPLLVSADGDVNAGTLGGAFDWLVRFLAHPDPGFTLASVGAARYGGRMLGALHELAAVLGCAQPVPPEPEATALGTEFDGPRTGSSVEPATLARACWALALLTEVGRGVPTENSPLARLRPDTVTAEELLGLAPAAAIEQLAACREQAEASLLPVLRERTGRWTLGPLFDGSELIAADADLIASGTLVEIKTSLGNKRKDGTRHTSLDRATLLQLVGYVLLDFDDHYALRELLLFQARYAYVVVWDLHELLHTLAGRSVDLSALRVEFARFLRAGRPPGSR